MQLSFSPLLLYISFSFLQRVSGSTAGDLLYTTLFNTDLYHPSEIYLKVIYNWIDAQWAKMVQKGPILCCCLGLVQVHKVLEVLRLINSKSMKFEPILYARKKWRHLLEKLANQSTLSFHNAYQPFLEFDITKVTSYFLYSF